VRNEITRKKKRVEKEKERREKERKRKSYIEPSSTGSGEEERTK
jgi:hypothetical protein